MPLLNNADGVYSGSTAAVKMYQGGTLIWTQGSNSVLGEAIWHVSADSINVDRFTDLSGNGRDAIFGTASAAPVHLDHSLTDYFYIPATDNGLQISAPTGTAWTATALDGTVTTGTTSADPWLFNEVGTWVRVESDNGNFIAVPSNVQADYTTITNTGSSGGTWTMVRSATGRRTAYVDRPLVIFGTARTAIAATALPTTTDLTTLTVFRRYSTIPGYEAVIDFGDGDGLADNFGTHIWNSLNSRVRWRANGVSSSMGDFPVTDGLTWIAATANSSGQGTYRDSNGNTDSNTSANWVGNLPNPPAVGTKSTVGNHFTGEFVAAAVFQRVLSNAEIDATLQEMINPVQSIAGVYQFSAEGGTDGASVLSTDSYEDAFDVVSGVIKYSSSNAFNGSTGLVLESGASTRFLQWNHTSDTGAQGAGFWFKPSLAPATEGRLLDFRTSTPATVGGLSYMPNGSIRILQGSSSIASTESPVLTAGQWYWITLGMNGSTSEARLAIYTTAGATLHDTGNVAVTLPASVWGTVRIGCVTSRDLGTAAFDDLLWRTTSADLIQPT